MDCGWSWPAILDRTHRGPWARRWMVHKSDLLGLLALVLLLVLVLVLVLVLFERGRPSGMLPCPQAEPSSVRFAQAIPEGIA